MILSNITYSCPDSTFGWVAIAVVIVASAVYWFTFVRKTD